MPDALVAQLTSRREQKLAVIDVIANQASDDGRDLTDQDLATIDDAKSHIRSYNTQLEKLLDDYELAEDAQNRLNRVGRSGAIGGDFQYRSDGELLHDILHQTDPDALSRYRKVLRRAAEHMGTLVANTTPTAGDLAGLVVRPVVGPVINPYSTGMPLASAVGMRDVPASNGFGFSRPQVVDANLTTGAGTQALEKAELASKAFTITTTNVNLATVGGYLNISQQLLSFAPDSLGIILDQLRIRLEDDIEGQAKTAIDTGATKVTLAAGAAADVILKAIFTAAANYYNSTKSMPSWLAMGPLGWARLGGLTDLAGRPMFPTLGAANAPGSMAATSFAGSVAGLQATVTPSITDDTFYVGGGSAIEGYLFRYPVLEAVEPSVLGRQVAVAASLAFYKPTPFVGAIQHLFP